MQRLPPYPVSTSHRRRDVWLAAVLLTSALACRQPPVTASEVRLELDPQSLTFPPTVVGGRATLTLEARSVGRAVISVSTQVDGPFDVEPRQLEADAEGRHVTLAFVPTQLGPASGTLHLFFEGTTQDVALAGTGVAAPDCGGGGPCVERRHYDPALGSCVDVFRADESACESECVTAGQCASGVCLGTAVNCDDGDACTVDACGLKGCVHAPVVCATPGDPCHTPVCDPGSGCGVAEVPDGTSCGAHDCTTAHVCLNGACQEVPSPEGASCGTASPCQSAGTCHLGTCEQAPPSMLTPVWSTTPTTTLDFPGLADADGNLYWFEMTPGSTELVSVDWNGVPRFRHPVGGRPVPFDRFVASNRSTLGSKDVLVALVEALSSPARHSAIEAYRTTDGALLWRHDEQDLAMVLGLSSNTQSFALSDLVAQPEAGAVVALLRTNQGGSAWASWVLAFDLSSGALRWQWRADYLSSLVGDGAGHVTTTQQLQQHQLVTLGPSGTVAWSESTRAEGPAISWGGTLMTAGYPPAVRDHATGAVVGTFAPNVSAALNEPRALGSGDQLVLPDSSTVCARWLVSLRKSDQQVAWTWASANCLQDPLLTQRGSVLINTFPPTLREIDRGNEVFACPLPTTELSGRSILRAGRWVTSTGHQVFAFDVPGLDLAPTGWVCAGGGLARGNSPRP